MRRSLTGLITLLVIGLVLFGLEAFVPSYGALTLGGIASLVRGTGRARRLRMGTNPPACHFRAWAILRDLFLLADMIRSSGDRWQSRGASRELENK